MTIALNEMPSTDLPAASTRERLAHVAPSKAPVLLVGGTRELFDTTARLLHVMSPRAAGAFAITRCGLYRGPLLEKRFFGKTDNSRGYIRTPDRQPGHIESAHGGTLYINQLQHATPLMQQRLLQLLDEESFISPETGERFASDVRVVASSGMPLEMAVRRGRIDPRLARRFHVISVRDQAAWPRLSFVRTL